jgi:hypothetical protein
MYPLKPDYITIIETNYHRNELMREAEQRQLAREAAAIQLPRRSAIHLFALFAAFVLRWRQVWSNMPTFAKQQMKHSPMKQG